MAEYNKVMEERNRMCDYYCKNYGIGEECSLECPLSGKNNPDLRYCSGCDEFLYKEAEKAEQIIMKWAREHPIPPPPVYPRVRDILNSIAILMDYQMNKFDENFLDLPINEKVAKRFEIRPINEYGLN